MSIFELLRDEREKVARACMIIRPYVLLSSQMLASVSHFRFVDANALIYKTVSHPATHP